MNKVYIIHGWDGSPREPMHQWMKAELEKLDFSVVVPKMPNRSRPDMNSWINHLKEIIDLNDDVCLIGHSIGCNAILRYLGRIDGKITGVVLIAPWMHLTEKTIEEGNEVIETARPWVEAPMNWEKIKSNMKNQAVCIFSDNDIYVSLNEADFFKKKLNAKTIIEHDRGHFKKSDNITENRTAVSEIMSFKKIKKKSQSKSS